MSQGTCIRFTCVPDRSNLLLVIKRLFPRKQGSLSRELPEEPDGGLVILR